MIVTQENYATVMRRIEQLWDASKGTPEGDELDALIDAVEAYEERMVSDEWSKKDDGSHNGLRVAGKVIPKDAKANP